MRHIATTVMAFTLIAGMAAAAWADALSDAKRAGFVGERQDGYLGMVTSSPSADVRALVSDVNARRKAEYQSIATKNGQPVSVVEKLAAAKAIEKTLPGNYVMDAGGNWVKK